MFDMNFTTIREEPDFLDCLDPKTFDASQRLGRQLVTHGSGLDHISQREAQGRSLRRVLSSPVGGKCAGGETWCVYLR